MPTTRETASLERLRAEAEAQVQRLEQAGVTAAITGVLDHPGIAQTIAVWGDQLRAAAASQRSTAPREVVVTITLGDVSEVVRCTYRPAGLRAAPASGGQAELAAALAGTIVTWDITHNGGQPYPITPASVAVLHADVLAALVDAIVADLGSDDATISNVATDAID